MEQRPDLSDNPFLKIDDPREKTAPMQQAAQDKALEFGRLCYSVFHQYEDGKRLWAFLTETYLLQQQVDPTLANAPHLTLWWDGFKSALLGMYNTGELYIKRVNGVG